MSKIVRSAIVPVVDAETKRVYLSVVEKARDGTIETLAEKVAAGRSTGDANLKTFLANHPKSAVWSSKAANVRTNLTARSVANQAAFWQRSGFKVENLAAIKQVFGDAIRAKIKSMREKSAAAVTA